MQNHATLLKSFGIQDGIQKKAYSYNFIKIKVNKFNSTLCIGIPGRFCNQLPCNNPEKRLDLPGFTHSANVENHPFLHRILVMRTHIVTFLILLMAVMPAWSAARVCHPVRIAPVLASQAVPAADHHCCPDSQHHTAQQLSADHTCHCDQLQHAQFILSLPVIPFTAPGCGFVPATLPLQILTGCTGVPYRPPIA